MKMRERMSLQQTRDAPYCGKCSARGGVVQNESRGVVGAERGARRGVLGERRTNQEEHPPEYSIQKPAYYAYGQVQGGGYRNMDTTGSFNLRGKREYERHSGTGISLEEKRGGRVAWNRGCVQDPISMGDVGVNVKPDAGGIPPEAGQQPAEMAGENHLSEVEGDVVVQVDMEMSLDEWKALQERSRPKAEFNLRKLDCKVPSKARVIHKSKRIENLKAVSVEEQEEDCHFPSLRRSANDITSHLEFNFGSLLRPSRGGRGQGRGGRGGMTEKAYILAPNPEDPDDFPALAVGR
eukprot:XP_014017332.1 PREDICTED: intracellular hyaluronan-binding protein 4 isoform X2 [Salmo salar]